MINYTLIEDTLTAIARDAVGKYLSTLNVANTPSVIITRPNIVKPKFPYITLSRLSTQTPNGWRYNEKVNEDCSVSITTLKTVQFQFTVFGSDGCTGATAHDIANELEGYFRLGSVMKKLCDESGASFDKVFPVTDASETTNASEQLESAFFTMTVNVYDEITHSPGTIDTICWEGTVNPADSDTPIVFTSEVTEEDN